MSTPQQPEMMDNLIDEDFSDEEIVNAIRDSMKDLKVSASKADPEAGNHRPTVSASLPTPKRNKKLVKPGLNFVADVVHKDDKKDLSKLSEAEQLALALKQSELESLSPEEQVRRALEVSDFSLNRAIYSVEQRTLPVFL